MTDLTQTNPAPPAGDAQPGSGSARPAIRPVWISLLLAAVTLFVFCPVVRFQFVNLDDPVYVTANAQVLKGLTLEGASWALRTGHGGNWHPLTWFSHMLDAQLFGPGPAGPHAVNLLFHVVNTLLLFGLLRRLTGTIWRSAFVAALFALHPLHVESVAWISERKDVLSAFFFLLTLWAYVRSVERGVRSAESNAAPSALPAPGSPKPASVFHLPSSSFYLLSLLCSVLGLMSKPMLVTVPFLLLLLDWWPLGRLRPGGALGLLREKLPFFLLSAASCVVTFMVQKQGGAVQSLSHLSLPTRLENTPVAYARYLGKTLWPAGLATPYPRADHWSLFQVLLALALLAGLTLGAVWLSRRLRFVGTGWFWFLGMLVPVIGLVQVGEQALADRYTYLPLIGLFIILAWEAGAACRQWRLPKAACAGAAAMVLFACAAQTRQQLGYWQNSETLYLRDLAVTRNNWLAAYNLGRFLDEQGRIDEALIYYQQAVTMEPRTSDALNNIGVILVGKKRYAEAIPYFERALKVEPGFYEAHNNIGKALEELGKLDEAIAEYRLVLQKKPDHVSALNNLGNALARKGQWPEAIQQYQASLQAKPDQVTAHYSLGSAFARLGRVDDAIVHYRQALQRSPDNAAVHNHLGLALARKGNFDEALLHFRQAVRAQPEDPDFLCNLGRTLVSQQKADEAIPLYLQALRIAPTNASVHLALGMALAAAGKLEEATARFEEAVRLRPDSASAHFSLGRALAIQRRNDRAIQHFTEALRLKPDLAEAREALRVLTGQAPP